MAPGSFGAFFENINDCAIILNAKGNTIVRTNQAFKTHMATIQLTESDEGEVNFAQRFIHDDDADLFNQAVADGSAGVALKTLITGDGKMPFYRSVTWTLSTQADEVYCVGRFQSSNDEKNATELSEFHDFFDNAPIAMHWLGGDGCVVWANKTEMDTLGYTAEEYIGKPIMNFCPDEKELVLEIFKQLGSGSAIADVPVRFRAKNGDIKYLLIDSNVKWKSTPDGERQFDHTRCFIRDDTRRKIREAELAQEAKLKERELLFAQINHDLRTPLNGILGYTHLLLKSTLTAEQKEFLGIVNTSADGMLKIVNSMLDCISMTKADHKFVKEKMNLQENLEGSVGLVAIQAEDGVNVGLRIAQHVPANIYTDGSKVRQLVINLVGNAIKFVSSGYVTVEVDMEAIPGAIVTPLPFKTVDESFKQLSFYDGNERPKSYHDPRPGLIDVKLLIKITDTGIGMTPEECASLFTPYQQANDEIKGLFGGTGLGLYICKQFTNGMGGKVSASSRKGVGSTFFVEIVVSVDPKDLPADFGPLHSSVPSPRSSMEPQNVLTPGKKMILAPVLPNPPNVTRDVSTYKGRTCAVLMDFKFDEETLRQYSESNGLTLIQSPTLDHLVEVTNNNNVDLVLTSQHDPEMVAALYKAHAKPVVLLAPSGKSIPKDVPNDSFVLLSLPFNVSKFAAAFKTCTSKVKPPQRRHKSRPAHITVARRLLPKLSQCKAGSMEPDIMGVPHLMPSSLSGGVEGLRVLLLDNQPMLLRLQVRLFADAGCTTVDSASDVEEALRLLREKTYDVVLFDEHLGAGQRSGTQVCKAAKDIVYDHDEVVWVSLSGDSDALENRKSHFDLLLTKPIKPSDLSKRIPRAVRKKYQRRMKFRATTCRTSTSSIGSSSPGFSLGDSSEPYSSKSPVN